MSNQMILETGSRIQNSIVFLGKGEINIQSNKIILCLCIYLYFCQLLPKINCITLNHFKI